MLTRYHTTKTPDYCTKHATSVIFSTPSAVTLNKLRLLTHYTLHSFISLSSQNKWTYKLFWYPYYNKQGVE
jgi:hypothetical protein